MIDLEQPADARRRVFCRVASSRVRCAMVIESEFAITKLPTKRATPPKPSRNFCRNEMNAIRVLAVLLCLPLAGAHLRVGWEDLSDLAATAGRSATFGLDATAISSSLPGLPNSPCAVGRSKPASVAPPIVDDRARTLRCRRPVSRCDRADGLHADASGRSRKCSLSAVDLSITTSFCFGHEPSTSAERIERRVAPRDAEAEVWARRRRRSPCRPCRSAAPRR